MQGLETSGIRRYFDADGRRKSRVRFERNSKAKNDQNNCVAPAFLSEEDADCLVGMEEWR